VLIKETLNRRFFKDRFEMKRQRLYKSLFPKANKAAGHPLTG